MKQAFGNFGGWALGISLIFQYSSYNALTIAKRNSEWEDKFRKYATNLIYEQQAIIENQNKALQEYTHLPPTKIMKNTEIQVEIWEEPLDSSAIVAPDSTYSQTKSSDEKTR